MEIKRIWKKDENGILATDKNKKFIIDHVTVSRLTKIQKFTQKRIDECISFGFMSLVKGQLIIHAQPVDVVYNMISMPGHYCCFDNKKMDDEKSARAYVVANFEGQESPDTANPAGYRKDNFHLCELVGEI